jgi:magnesium chelatase family protein
MTIKTVFNNSGFWEKGEVEVQLMAGIPNLHVVGLPDTQIKEAGIKLKSALKACGFSWPRGHQIIVNLRPNHFRKTSAGVELAIALGFLVVTKQLKPALREAALRSYVYGEVALDGRVLAPHDLPLALRGAKGEVLTGVVGDNLREGEWSEIESLKAEEPARKVRFFDWEAFWNKPVVPDLTLHPEAANALLVAAQMNLHVLLAGPQGSGKSTWAKILYSLTEAPDEGLFLEREEWVGVDDDLRWRPFEQPHHSITPLAMIGGSYPIRPGVVSRAHGGMLVMDEFLEFHPAVLENLREPIESGHVEIARKGARERIPARFQLVGTTNLCPCGKLNPEKRMGCTRALYLCKSVINRLSGPMMDRFDAVILSHKWNDLAERVSVAEIVEKLERARAFRKKRGAEVTELPDWVKILGLTFRRQNSLLRVARGLADLDQSLQVQPRHFSEAAAFVTNTIEDLNRVFA